MSVDTTNRKQTFTLDGETTEFTFTFNALRAAPTDIKCRNTTTDTDLTYTTDYSVVVNSDGSGGVVTLVDAGTADQSLLVYRDTTDKQESVYDDYNQFPADSVEKDFDRRTLKSQELEEAIIRSVKADITSALTGSALNLPSPTAGLALKWGPSASTIINSNYDPDEQVDNASSYATIAQGHSEDADSYSTIAEDKATEASSYSTIASDKADESESYSNISLSHSEDASSYATIASDKATEASSYSTIASDKADESSSYATIAQGHSEDSESYSNIALSAKTNAETAETNASSHSTTALGAKDDAESYSTIASTKATEASSHATTALGHADTAGSHSTVAGSHATTAQEAADSLTVIDSLTSTSSTNALSANQGKVLNDGKVEEAPEDTNQYARKDAGWVQVEGGDKIHLEQTPQTLSDGANISWNMNSGGFGIVTLGGNRILDNPTNVVTGGTYRLIVKQDATGSRTLAYGTNYKFPGGVDPVLSSGANDVDLLEFIAEDASTLRLVNAIFDSQ